MANGSAVSAAELVHVSVVSPSKITSGGSDVDKYAFPKDTRKLLVSSGVSHLQGMDGALVDYQQGGGGGWKFRPVKRSRKWDQLLKGTKRVDAGDHMRALIEGKDMVEEMTYRVPKGTLDLSLKKRYQLTKQFIEHERQQKQQQMSL